MKTKHTETAESSSRILAHLNDGYFSVFGAFIPKHKRTFNLVLHWQLKLTLRNLGYHVIIIEVVPRGNEEKGSYLYFFVPNLSYEKALELGAEFSQEAILAKENEEILVLGRVSPKEGDGYVIKRFPASPLTESAFIDALIEYLKMSHWGEHHAIHELTRVPLHCAHHLEYPYARCYTFNHQQ